MGPSRQVLVLLNMLARGAVRRDAARDLFGGAPGAFEATLVEAGSLIHRFHKQYGDGQPVWFLELTAEGVMALADAGRAARA